MTVAGVNMISQSCEIDHSECHCGSGRHTLETHLSPRFVKPGALIRILGPRTLGLPLVANAAIYRPETLYITQNKHGMLFTGTRIHIVPNSAYLRRFGGDLWWFGVVCGGLSSSHQCLSQELKKVR